MKAPVSRERRRSNDGILGAGSRVLPIRPGLLASLLAEFHQPLQRAKPKTFHGPNATYGAPPIRLSDEQVLALRKMRHWHGMTHRQIVAATGLDPNAVACLCEFRNRVHLDPGPRPTNIEQGA